MDERAPQTLSVRQLAVCAFAGGLSSAAAGAGHGWQGPLLALPVVMLAGWGLSALAPRWKKAEDRWTGRFLSALYALWGVALLSRGLARSAERVIHAGGSETRYVVWLVLLLAIPLVWMGLGKPAAFFRAVELFCPALAVAGAILLVWGLCHVEWRYVALPAGDLKAGFLSALETGGTFLFLLPLVDRTREGAAGLQRMWGWPGALGAACALMALVTVGVLSPAVAAGADEAFFLMTATLGRAVRVEGLAGAIWLLADLSLLGLYARSWQRRGTGVSRLPALAVITGAALALMGLPDLVPASFWGWGTAVMAALTGVALWASG